MPSSFMLPCMTCSAMSFPVCYIDRKYGFLYRKMEDLYFVFQLIVDGFANSYAVATGHVACQFHIQHFLKGF